MSTFRIKSLACLLAVVAFLNLHAQQQIDLGPLKGGGYKVFMPANWNHKLVMFAHGYQFMGSPASSGNAGLEKRLQLVLDRGFALAASDFPLQGWALPQAVDATEELRAAFAKRFGKPDSTFMIGQSMGGGVAVSVMEQFGANYDGSLPMCPLSSRPYLQLRKEFDMYATFNGLFPGILPALKDVLDPDNGFKPTPIHEAGAKMKSIMETILAKDSLLAVLFARRFDLKLQDLPAALFFNINVLRDIALKAEGNPFDNTHTLYSGFPDDLRVNAAAERVSATQPSGKLFERYDKTGNISKPMLIVHTIYDPLIPITYAVTNYQNLVIKQNRDAFLAVKYTNGQAHCDFSPAETAQAFDALRAWATDGKKPAFGQLK